MRVAILLGLLLIPTSVQAQNRFAPRLDELTPPSGQPICDSCIENKRYLSLAAHPISLTRFAPGSFLR
jgi:hypothetical protein